MQASRGTDLVQKLKVLNLYKQLYRNVKQPQSTTQFVELLRNEFRQNSVSDSRYCMQKDEMYFVANAYQTYLSSTKRTLELYAKYCKGERSIQESAEKVGLRLPKQYQPPSN